RAAMWRSTCGGVVYHRPATRRPRAPTGPTVRARHLCYRCRMIERLPFGRTGHASSRVIFGAAALAAMRQEKADRILDLLLEHGINHIDTAAAYGDSELRVGAWMARHRDRFFVATKTGERTAE